tara:strand:- start:378 stop:560 length:183 start_codon:yes stop_codon:yes gene_type:complete
MDKGTKQDLKMLINELDNFYSHRGKNFFELLDADVRIDLEDRMYKLQEDLEENLEKLNNA